MRHVEGFRPTRERIIAREIRKLELRRLRQRTDPLPGAADRQAGAKRSEGRAR